MPYDALVIGGSFAGLSGAMQIARSGRRVCVLDGGQPRNRFADASHGLFSRDRTPPRQIIAQARVDLAAYSNVTLIDALATRARRDEDGFLVTLASGETLAARRLLLAFGIVDLLPDLPGVRERWGRTVLHCPYCHGYEVRGQRLGVLFSGPPSVHQALLISDWGPTTLFLNGAPRPDDLALARLGARGVTLEPTPVAGLEGDAPDLSGLRLADGRAVPLGALFLAPRSRLSSDLAKQLGCALVDGPLGPLIRTDALNQTTVPGVYAAGDITRVGNVTLASADGVVAGGSLHQSLIFGPLERVGQAAGTGEG